MGPLILASTTSQKKEKSINVTLKRLQHSYLNIVIFSYQFQLGIGSVI